MKRSTQIAFALAAFMAGISAQAHELQTAALRLDEAANGAVTASLSTPLTREGQPSTVVPLFDPRCSVAGEARVERELKRVIRQWQLHCTGGLAGTHLGIAGLDPRMPDALIMVNFADGATRTLALDRHDPRLTLSPDAPKSAAPGVAAYLPIGIEHILLGPDHLLFVFGLMLVVSSRRSNLRMLVAALTAFTLAHSLTLGLAMFGIWGLPPKPVEILIALSIVLLAVELTAHAHRQRLGLPPTLTLRKPWLVAFVFGLLHGFGFAGALSEIGLPEAARGWALLLFNLGVEIGQLLFVGSVLLLLWLARRLRPMARPEASPALTAVVVLFGGIAVYWTLDRGAIWLQASGINLAM